MREIQPTAEGDLGRTPFAHLLIYALDRRLTGALFLEEPAAGEAPARTHVVRFARGAPVKVRPGDAHAMLGEMLVEAGALAPETLKEALATKGLLGDVLLLAGCIDRNTLERIAEEQFVRRILRLFACAPETTYAYYDGHIELVDWGGDPAGVDPLWLLWRGLSQHAEASTMIEGALARLGDTPLSLHAGAVVTRFGFEGEASDVVSRIKSTEAPLSDLVASNVAPEAVVRSVVYTLVIARQFELGTSSSPVGADDVRSTPPIATLGRVQLRTSVHRLGAAAPDLPGTGERPVAPRRRAGVSSTVTSPAAPAAPGNEAPESVTEIPEVPELMELALACLEEGDIDAGLQACTVAHELDPTAPEPRALSVWIRARAPEADLEELVKELDEVLAENADVASARRYRALIRHAMGDGSGALADARRAAELMPDDPDVARELAEIEASAPDAPG